MKGCWHRLRAPMATGPVALEPPSSPLPFSTDLHPWAALSWPENHIFRRRFVEAIRTSSSKFSFVSPPNRSSKAPGARQDCKRDLRRVKVARTICIEVRGIHHRANHSFRAKVEFCRKSLKPLKTLEYALISSISGKMELRSVT
ncbi:F-box family protein with DUF295 [Prunus dulcis]|uniref:F-box family protein with DUF295 n=1 Tax=Prunus dulcis TaxID=3755 RepID=A0A4Y1S2F1_PRUDU|nr:F-box family protein with DUF295 [Prunus dulcis]